MPLRDNNAILSIKSQIKLNNRMIFLKISLTKIIKRIISPNFTFVFYLIQKLREKNINQLLTINI